MQGVIYAYAFRFLDFRFLPSNNLSIFLRDVGEEIQCEESARKKGIVVVVGSPAELSAIAGEMKVSAKVGKNIRLYAMTNRFPDRYTDNKCRSKQKRRIHPENVRKITFKSTFPNKHTTLR